MENPILILNGVKRIASKNLIVQPQYINYNKL